MLNGGALLGRTDWVALAEQNGCRILVPSGAIAGLDAVQQRGVDAGSLFCAADNTGALHLYESLGFTMHRTDRAYECEVRSP